MDPKRRGAAWSIGGFQLKGPFLAAPMAGVTDCAFRQLAGQMGAALVYSEMISAKGLVYTEKNSARLLKHLPDEGPIAYQLFGAEPYFLKEATKKIAHLDHVMLDINMGCPVPKVVKNSEGSALMKDWRLAVSVLRAVMEGEEEAAALAERKPRPVTVKCRLGWDEEHVNVLDFCRHMEEAGAAAVAVHGRTKSQLYSGKADWETIGAVKEALSIPVIGSGDVFTAEDAVNMYRQTGVDGVMIARGALGDPWIFRDAEDLLDRDIAPREHDLRERVIMAKQHLQLAIDDKGEKVAVQEMRKQVGWYMKGMKGSAKLRGRLGSMNTAAEMGEALDALLG